MKYTIEEAAMDIVENKDVIALQFPFSIVAETYGHDASRLAYYLKKQDFIYTEYRDMLINRDLNSKLMIGEEIDIDWIMTEYGVSIITARKLMKESYDW